MIEVNAIWFLSISLLVISFLAIVFIAKIFTNSFDGIKFSFMRVFPYEVIENNEKFPLIYKGFLYLFSIICIFPLFALASEKVQFNAFYLASIMLTFSGVCFVFLNFFDATHTKAHLLLFVLFGCFCLLGNLINASVTLTYLLNERFYETNKSFAILKISISIILALLQITIYVNPKLKDWAKLDKNEAGQLSRPKRFPLAYSEWATLLVLFLSVVNLYISILR